MRYPFNIELTVDIYILLIIIYIAVNKCQQVSTSLQCQQCQQPLTDKRLIMNIQRVSTVNFFIC